MSKVLAFSGAILFVPLLLAVSIPAQTQEKPAPSPAARPPSTEGAAATQAEKTPSPAPTFTPTQTPTPTPTPTSTATVTVTPTATITPTPTSTPTPTVTPTSTQTPLPRNLNSERELYNYFQRAPDRNPPQLTFTPTAIRTPSKEDDKKVKLEPVDLGYLEDSDKEEGFKLQLKTNQYNSLIRVAVDSREPTYSGLGKDETATLVVGPPINRYASIARYFYSSDQGITLKSAESYLVVLKSVASAYSTYKQVQDFIDNNVGRGVSAPNADITYRQKTDTLAPASATVNTALIDSVLIAISDIDFGNIVGCQWALDPNTAVSSLGSQDLCYFKFRAFPAPGTKAHVRQDIFAKGFEVTVPFMNLVFLPEKAGPSGEFTFRLDDAGNLNLSRPTEVVKLAFALRVWKCTPIGKAKGDRLTPADVCELSPLPSVNKPFVVTLAPRQFDMDFSAGFALSRVVDEAAELKSVNGSSVVQTSELQNSMRPAILAMAHFFPVSRTFRYWSPALSFGLGVGDTQKPLSYFGAVSVRFPSFFAQKYFVFSGGVNWAQVQRISPSQLGQPLPPNADLASVYRSVYEPGVFVSITLGLLGGEDKFKAVYEGKTK